MTNVEKLQLARDAEPISIAKPSEVSLDAFKSKRDPSVANVGTLLTALPHSTIAQAKDWVRTHPDDEDYWSSDAGESRRGDQGTAAPVRSQPRHRCPDL
jgi:hypothetical protein